MSMYSYVSDIYCSLTPLQCKHIRLVAAQGHCILVCSDAKAKVPVDKEAVKNQIRVWNAPHLPDHGFPGSSHPLLIPLGSLHVRMDSPANVDRLRAGKMASTGSGQAYYTVHIEGQDSMSPIARLIHFLAMFEHNPRMFDTDGNGRYPWGFFELVDGGSDFRLKYFGSVFVSCLLKVMFGFKNVIAFSYAPYNSKMNPAERPHAEVNRALYGEVQLYEVACSD